MQANESNTSAEAHYRQGIITLDVCGWDPVDMADQPKSLPLSLSQAQRLAIQLVTAVALAEQGT